MAYAKPLRRQDDGQPRQQRTFKPRSREERPARQEHQTANTLPTVHLNGVTWLQREASDAKYKVSQAISRANLFLTSNKRQPLDPRHWQALDRDRKITIVELNEIAEDLIQKGLADHWESRRQEG